MNFTKKLTIISTLFLCVICLVGVLPKTTFAAGEFITTWRTDNPGSSNSTSITIPTYPGETYNYSVDWNNDGTPDQTGITGDVTHDFGAEGLYTIRITGTFPRIYFNNSGDAQKITSVDQWGTNVWSSMERAFFGCMLLFINATDTPDLSQVTSMSMMFRSAPYINQDFSSWSVLGVTDMSLMFNDASSFNQNINSWNVSNVTNMSGMFKGAASFNQPLNSWSISGVTDISEMFYGAVSFNQNINSWDTGSITNMSGLFRNALSFNQPLNDWNVSSVGDMTLMFDAATAFNQPLDQWDMHNVQLTEIMMRDTYAFDQDLSSWDMTANYDAFNMFDNSGLSVKNYDKLLRGWSQQTLLVDNDLGADGLLYCDQAAHDILTDTFNWSILDAGLANCHTLTYIAGVGGAISSTSQTIADGEDADPVTATPNSGYTFLKWSDNSTDNPRTDTNVTGDITVTAIFKKLGGTTISGSIITQPREPKETETKLEPKDVLGSGTCPTNLMVSNFMKQGDKNGQYSRYYGKEISEVKLLQSHINRILAAKYDQAAGPVDGIFGPLTKRGVQRLQTVLRDDIKLNLGPAGTDGIVGPFTRDAINHSCGNM